MASKAAAKRLSKEYVSMQKEPPPYVWAAPEEDNILTWNFILRGPEDSPFRGGEYHGVLLFPSEYPFKPPGIKMLTPSARFQPDRRICFSMSDFHPGSWNPAWSVATILTGLLSFMLSDEITTGGLASSDSAKAMYAARSHDWNTKSSRFRDAFPEYAVLTMKNLPNMGERDRGVSDALPPPPSDPAPVIASQADNNADNNVNNDKVAATKDNGGQQRWGRVLWDKWRWGLFIALAVIVSRLTTGPK